MVHGHNKYLNVTYLDDLAKHKGLAIASSFSLCTDIHYYINAYITAKGVATMLVKINKKPITVTDEDNEEKDFDPIYFSISVLGYGLILCLLDYVCFLFFGHYALPLLHFVWGLFL